MRDKQPSTPPRAQDPFKKGAEAMSHKSASRPAARMAKREPADPVATGKTARRSKLQSIAKRQADERIKALAPDLSVASSDTAANARALEGKPASAFAPSSSEPFHDVGARGEPEFENGWSNLGSGRSSAAFYRDPLGVVHLKGTIAGPAGSVAFTLPPGYRPAEELFMAAAGPVHSQLRVSAGGGVTLICASGGTCVAGIDGASFRAA